MAMTLDELKQFASNNPTQAEWALQRMLTHNYVYDENTTLISNTNPDES